jgi:7,8-didemethyl-8-hydroxy-5-deazariboflavin synthase CofH subunit
MSSASVSKNMSTSDALAAALAAASPDVRSILDGALTGREVSEADAVVLFETAGDDLNAVLRSADEARRQAVGDAVTFVVNRNINFTNVCYMGCRFCNFAKRQEDPDAELLSMDAVAARASEAWSRGGTEVCIQGGLHPKIDGSHYRDILKAIKREVPDMHIHAFSPFEIWYGARKSRMSYGEFLTDLKDCGLGSVPGTAAEILDTDVRKVLTQDKLSAEAWVEIIRAVHEAGLPSTATIMYGHVDGPAQWAAHIALIRSIQKDTGGFTEFVPLGFIHDETSLFRDVPGVRPGPTRDENLKMHAVARLMLMGWIDNIQVSWVKLGPALAQEVLQCGANDFGGTMMNESISRAAGASWGQEVTPHEMAGIIRGAGAERVPVQRTTLYTHLSTFDETDPDVTLPLVPRAGQSAAEAVARRSSLS